MSGTTLPPSILRSHTGGLASSQRQAVRAVGGVFPEQQTFLGATIKSFSIQAGGGSSPTTLNVELIRDPNGTNPTVDDPNKSRGVYDPYHHNQTGDAFSPPGVGMPVFFVYSNPRMTIRDAFNGVAPPNNGSVLKFGGLLQSFHSTSSVSQHSYSVTVVDPREILSNTYMILNHSDYKIGLNENNVYNIFGFLEYNPTVAIRNIFNNYTNNIATRGTGGFAGDDMYYNIAIPDASANPSHYFDNVGYTNKFPITGTGMSRRGSYGMPYYRIMQGIAAINASLPSTEYNNFSGGLYYRGLSYNVNFSNLPPVPSMYCFDHDNIDLLSFVLEIAEATGHEVDISLRPNFGAGSSSGGIIDVYFIDRSNESTVGQINSFINNTSNFPMSKDQETGEEYSLLEKTDIGYELTNPTTSRVLFGANRVDLHAFTSNHDDGRYYQAMAGQSGSSVYNQILPFYGTIGDNMCVPVKGRGPWKQILLDSSGLGAYGVGNYYVATETELRYALKGFKAWKNFLEFYNAKYLDVLSAKGRYVDNAIGGGIPVTDDENGNHRKGLKCPRCLFVNDQGFSNGYPNNPCSPPFGFPLYYNRAVAIGLTVKKVFDETDSVVADLKILQSTMGANTGNSTSVLQVVNALLEKYKKLSRSRRLTPAEKQAIQSISAQGAGADGAFLDSIISSMTGQHVVLKENVAIRKVNAQKVFNFVKNVAEECYGKKWLVRIPPKPNYAFGPITLGANKSVYTAGPFGIKPEGNGNPGNALSGGSFVGASNDPVFSSAQQDFKPALITNYNPVDDQLVYNYTPNETGGFVDFNLYNNSVAAALMPANLSGFGTNYRIKAYVRYDHVEELNIASANSKVYTEYVGARTNAVPSKTLALDGQDKQTSANTMIGFMPVELDTKLYYPPVSIGRTALCCNRYIRRTYRKPVPVTLDSSGNVPAGAGNLKTNIQFEPLYFGFNQNISDFARSSDGQLLNNPDLDYAYALITLPSIVSPKRDSISDIPKKQRFNLGTAPEHFTDNATLGTVTSVTISKKIDYTNYGSSLTFYNPDRLFSMPPCVKPDVVVLPLENHQSCYGPWTTGPIRYKDSGGNYRYKQLKNMGGKVDIETDGSLAPWNFGSYELMNIAANSRVSLAGTLYLASEKGSVSFPGLPMGNVDIGGLIAQGGPILDSLSMDVGVEGVRSSYRFQTYSRSFAHIQRQQQKQIDAIKNKTLKAGSVQFDLMNKSLIKNKFRGLPPPASITKPYTPAVDPGYSSPGVNNLSITSMVSTKNATVSQSSISSSESFQEVLENDPDTLSQLRDMNNSAIEDLSDKKIAVSRQAHHLLPGMVSAELKQLESLYAQPTDPYNIDSHHITYWS
jgi:hypothetical protein